MPAYQGMNSFSTTAPFGMVRYFPTGDWPETLGTLSSLPSRTKAFKEMSKSEGKEEEKDEDEEIVIKPYSRKRKR
jgi:hypothetical protein